MPVFKDLSVPQKGKNVFKKEIIFYKKLLKEKNYYYIKKEFYINSFFNNLVFR